MNAISSAARAAGLLLILGAAACKDEAPLPVYQAVPVERRDVIVSAQAAGAIQPDTTVEVKSKASGEVLQILAETGQEVRAGDLLVKIDPRIPRNTLAQAEADLMVARAQLTNAESQKSRADELYKSQSITQQEHEQALLDYANARANVIRSQVAVENAQIQLTDANVKAPSNGTIIEKGVERGQIIASATGNVSGGTVLLKMADLSLVQVRAMVDETDIGKIQPGMAATITVDAYPNRPFEGEVLKIEPQAVTEQNVTMFPVVVRIDNRGGLLRPGMNTEVELHIGRRENVLAVPAAALRTPRDVGSAAQVLGLDPERVQQQLAEQPAPDTAVDSTIGRASLGARTPQADSMKLPEGVTAEQVRAVFARMRSGETPSAEDRALMTKVRQLNRQLGGANGGGRGTGGRGRSRSGGGSAAQFGGEYIVFVIRGGQPTPVQIRTGLTDLDYAEVVSGLEESDSVLILPSASLVQSQQEFKDRFNRMTGGGAVPGMQQQQGSTGARSSSAPQGGGR